MTYKTNKTMYYIWSNMKQRCYNPNNSGYRNTGGKGIKVCDEWKDSFETFLKDMVECPEGYILKRIDIEGDYYPENCRFVSIRDNKKHKLYSTWNNMKMRCSNKNNHNYKYYGGRGITVCDEWENSFRAFVDDMGERPEGYTLDRIDNDGNYCPENCRWTDKTTQSENRRNTIKKKVKADYDRLVEQSLELWGEHKTTSRGVPSKIKIEDIYGKLRVITRVANYKKYKKSRWACLCECGILTDVRGIFLTSGKHTCCGCSK